MDVWNKMKHKHSSIPMAIQAALIQFLNPPLIQPEGKMFLAIAGSVLCPYEFVVWDRAASRVRDDMFPVVVKWDGEDRTRIKGTYLWQWQFRLGGRDVPIVVGPGAMIYCKMVDNE